MSYNQVQLRRLFSSSIGGSWGDPPEDRDVVLPCIRGTDLDFRRLRVKPDSAPLRSYTSQEVAYRAASQGDIIIEKSGGGDGQPVGRIALWDRFESVMPTNSQDGSGHHPATSRGTLPTCSLRSTTKGEQWQRSSKQLESRT